jgi:hypothetical protein
MRDQGRGMGGALITSVRPLPWGRGGDDWGVGAVGKEGLRAQGASGREENSALRATARPAPRARHAPRPPKGL